VKKSGIESSGIWHEYMYCQSLPTPSAEHTFGPGESRDMGSYSYLVRTCKERFQ
jgi:hypothetical protein